MRAALAVLLLSAAACGNQAQTALDAGGDAAGVPAEAGPTTGSVHVAWTLQRGDGSATDCITANTPNLWVDVTTAAQVRAASVAFYCVDMADSVSGLEPGDYLVALRLLDTTNGLAASAGGAATVTVTAGTTADAGTLTFVVQGP